MSILLFGATGKTGSCIRALLEANDTPHFCFVRSQDQARPGDYIGDVRDQEDVMEAMKEATGVISALGTEGNGTLLAGTRQLIGAMLHYRMNRIVTIGTAGILQSAMEPSLLRYQSSETRRTNHEAAKEHEQAYLALAHAPQLEWTIVCPTRLVHGQGSGRWREQANVLPPEGMQITFADTAAFTLKEYRDRSYIRQRVGICE